MGRFKFLVLLFALSVVGPLIPSVTANGAGPEWRVVSTQINIQLAQRGRCKAFGETNKCKVAGMVVRSRMFSVEMMV